jgi:hypothetical protein
MWCTHQIIHKRIGVSQQKTDGIEVYNLSLWSTTHPLVSHFVTTIYPFLHTPYHSFYCYCVFRLVPLMSSTTLTPTILSMS